MFYQGWMEQQAQKLVDATTKAFTQNRLLMRNANPNPTGAMPGPIPMVSRFMFIRFIFISAYSNG